MAVSLHAHQTKAVENLKNGSILTGGVGTGKTITSIAYYFTKVCGGALKPGGGVSLDRLTDPKDIYVITTAKKRDDLDWEAEAAAFGISTKREFSVGNVQIKVDSWNNIPNYADVKDAFFVFDEQRLVGSGAWVKAFLKIAKANQWIILSATPGDVWMDFCPVFIANGFYKNKTEFITRHVIYSRFSKFPKIDRYVDTGVLLKLRNSILVDMPYDRHTIRHVKHTLVEHNQVLFDKVYKNRWHIYEDRPIRDAGELYRVMRQLCNSDPSRLQKVIELQQKHPRLIVFYNFNYELNALRTLSGLLPQTKISEWNGHKHEPIPTGNQWVYLVQFVAGAEGWNCIETDATVFYSLPYSYKNYEQAQGRIDRLNTPYTDLFYFVFRSKAVIDSMIMKSLNLKRNFNERDYFPNMSW